MIQKTHLLTKPLRAFEYNKSRKAKPQDVVEKRVKMNAEFTEKVITKQVSKWQVSCQAFAGTQPEELAAMTALCYKDDDSDIGQAVYKQVCRQYPNADNFFQNTGCRRVDYNDKTGLSGVNIDGNIIRKGSVDAVQNYCLALGHAFPDACILAEKAARTLGHKTEVICKNGRVIGMVTLVLEQAVLSKNKKNENVLTA